jgi:hypothetical protein
MIAQSGSSSRVRLTLLIDDQHLSLSHVGSKAFVVRDACDPLPPSDALLVIEVNNSADTYKVFLPSGLPGPGQLVEYVEPNSRR